MQKKTRISKKSIRAPLFLNEPIEYNKSFSRGIRTTIGNTVMLFISGTASINENGKTCYPGDFQAQVKRTYDNLTALLESEGADWHDVVKTRCYLKDMKYYANFNAIRNRFYKEQQLDPFPASVGIQAELCRPELLIEIELVALYKLTEE